MESKNRNIKKNIRKKEEQIKIIGKDYRKKNFPFLKNRFNVLDMLDTLGDN